MRDLLGDKRFATYLRTSDAGFGRMSFVLDQIPEINDKMVLDLWWIRKKDELEDLRKIPWIISRQERKVEVYESAITVLGATGMTFYLQDDDSKWLKRKPTPQFGRTRIVMEKHELLRKSE